MTVRLDVINAMLATTGTAELLAEDSQHPEYKRADRALSDVVEEMNSRPLWFNSRVATLQADIDGRVVVPQGTLTCDPVDVKLKYVVRGQYLFDMENYTDIIGIGASVECNILTDVPLEDMPPAAIQFARALARYDYFLDRDGDQAKVARYSQKLQTQQVRLDIMNAKHIDTNFLRGGQASFFFTRRYPTGGTSGHIKIR